MKHARPSTPARKPHKLELYRLAVQRPWVQVNWLCNAYAQHNPGKWARRLREDFAGTSALAMAWTAHDHDHHALAIDNHGPTLRHAITRSRRLARQGLLDLSRITFTQSDVMAVDDPPADLIAALNFSVNIYHDLTSLTAYLSHARQNLAPHGLLVLDAYGGPGAWRTSTEHRRIRPPAHENIPPFDYYWEQREVDPLTGQVDCRIHFKTKTHGRIDNAFVYHWRLWSIPELLDALRAAGLGRCQVWCDEPDFPASQGGGELHPVQRIGPREHFLAYITAEKQAG